MTTKRAHRKSTRAEHIHVWGPTSALGFDRECLVATCGVERRPEVLQDIEDLAAELAEVDAERQRLLDRRDELVRVAREAGEKWHVIGHAAGVSHPTLLQRLAAANRLAAASRG